MKRVLFIGVTQYNFNKDAHFRKKFEGLSQEIKSFVLAKGKPFYKKIWNTEFYLLPPKFFWLLTLPLGFYLCLTKKIDTIIVQSPLVEGFIGTILKKMLKKELIVEIHGDWKEGPFLSKKRGAESLEKKLVPILANFSLKSADKIRVVADYLKEMAEKIAPSKPYFKFHTFTDLSIFLEEKDTRFDNYILFVGQLEKVKGVQYLIEAFAKIIKHNANDTNFYLNATNIKKFKLIIIGDGSEKENLKTKISNLKIENKVEFKGKLPLKETKDIMKNCYCLVLPSLSEGLPRVLMEAMALGKPVIASKVGGIPELIKDGEGGFLFQGTDSLDLAKKIKILLRNKNLAQEMGKNGKKLVSEKFSNEKYISAYIEMINN